MTTFQERREIESLDRAALERHQLEAINRLLDEVWASNTFYRQRLSGSPRRLDSLAELSTLPMMSQEDLEPASPADPLPAHASFAVERYVRFHQTSGTRGRPLAVLDTAEDWRGWIDGWQFVLDAADLTAADRAFLAFSFGPFIGFWSAFDALVARGVLVVPGGGLGSLARVDMIRRTGATALFCTPSYALRLAEVAAEHHVELAALPVEKIVVAGEPGGSVPAMRARIERAWGAEVIDHAGATEVGPWGYADRERRGLHVNESQFIAEFLSVETGAPARPGELAHLVLTSLGRAGCPVLRYQTADLVRPTWPASGSNRFVLLEGGVLGRADDMMIIRGMNVYPTAIEQILHSFPEVVEYRLVARKRGQLDEILVEVEDRLMQPGRIAEELHLKLGLKIDVQVVPPLSLPRFDGKGRRFVDQRKPSES